MYENWMSKKYKKKKFIIVLYIKNKNEIKYLWKYIENNWKVTFFEYNSIKIFQTLFLWGYENFSIF